jgi:hypothetical protein
MLEMKYFHGVGAFEVYLLKVSALKLSHRLPVPFLRTSASFPNYDTVSWGRGGRVRGVDCHASIRPD